MTVSSVAVGNRCRAQIKNLPSEKWVQVEWVILQHQCSPFAVEDRKHKLLCKYLPENRNLVKYRVRDPESLHPAQGEGDNAAAFSQLFSYEISTVLRLHLHLMKKLIIWRWYCTDYVRHSHLFRLWHLDENCCLKQHASVANATSERFPTFYLSLSCCNDINVVTLLNYSLLFYSYLLFNFYFQFRFRFQSSFACFSLSSLKQAR